MSNTYFQFKQFTIHQEKAALKVCTDACIFGAWMAERLQQAQAILDIGAGTGLLMMMVAQRSESRIHGIEIDIPSYAQATENIQAHVWQDRMQVFQGDVKKFPFSQQYDWIITNPPFYEQDLLSSKKEEQVAKHSTALTLNELLQVIDAQLILTGQFGILLPYHRFESFRSMAEKQGFYLQESMQVQQTPQHVPFRSLLIFGRNETAPIEHTMVIREENGDYTNDFKQLLQPYYLHL